ncbi:MAG: GGDEF domain-containing protein, partial [Acholeplasmatales bacterium]
DSIVRNTVNEADVFLHHKLGHRLKVHVKTLPVLEEGQVVGALEIFSPHDEKNLLQQALKHYQKKAMTDTLTALNNRAVLEDTVPGMIADSPDDVVFGIVFADIDNFKQFNDTYGHDLGDKVLVTLSKTLSNTVKPTDVLIRYGGEEFLIITYDVTAQSLVEQAEQIRRVVAASSLRDVDEQHRFTVSLGATLINRHEPITTAIERADKAMYESKRNGKNRVTVASCAPN